MVVLTLAQQVVVVVLEKMANDQETLILVAEVEMVANLI
jgi:hypothetical protein